MQESMQISSIRTVSTIFQRNIQYISDIKDIPWETDKYKKQSKDDNNQYTYQHNIYIINSSQGQVIQRHISTHYLHN